MENNTLIKSILSLCLYNTYGVRFYIKKNKNYQVIVSKWRESSFCQYETWEDERFNVFLNNNGDIVGGCYVHDISSQPSCSEIESYTKYDYTSQEFKDLLDFQYLYAKKLTNLVRYLSSNVNKIKNLNDNEEFYFEFNSAEDELEK